MHRQTSNIRHTLVGNSIIDYADVFGDFQLSPESA